MEHSSRKEKYQRKRSLSKRKYKRRWVSSAFIVAFFALAIILWLSYNNGTGGKSATPGDPNPNPNPKPQAGQGQVPSDGGKSGSGTGTETAGGKDKAPEGKGEPVVKNPNETDAPKTGSASPGTTGGSTVPAGNAGTTGGTGQNGGKTEDPGKTPSVTPPATAPEVPKETDDPNRVSLAFVGDVIFADNVDVALKANGYDYPYRQVRSYLETADLTIANLETPITERGTAAVKEYAYRSNPKALPAFKEAGFDLVNLANNHILDYGTTGLLDTFEHLDKTGIRWFGAGRNVAEAFKPVIVEKKGIKIAFLGLSKVVPTQDWKAGKDRPGVADTYALKLPLEAIQNAKKQADLVVVIAHWGVERQDQPEKYQKDYARQYIDAGADLIVGGHPHVLQGFENYKGKWIAYSLGNFIFTMNENPLTWESVILQATCSKEGGCALKTVPVLTKLANPEPMTEDAAAKLFDRLTGISFQSEVGRDGTVRIQNKK